MEMKYYESHEVKGLRIYDTRGIENGKYNLDEANKIINKEIQKLIKEQIPDKFIHCIWYCIHSDRFTNEELLNIKNCYDLYIESLPMIIVFTKSDNQALTNSKMEIVKKEFSQMIEKESKDIDIKILKILAQDSYGDLGIIHSFGIQKLMNETFESAEKGISRSFTQSYIEQGKKILIDEFKEIIKNLNEEIFKENQGNAPPAISYS